MSEENVYKKRKTSEASEDTEEQPSLGSAVELFKENAPAVFNGLQEWLQSNQPGLLEDVYAFMISTYKPAAELDNQYVVPSEFKGLHVERDEDGIITSISDEHDKLDGEHLKVILAISACAASGVDEVILGNTSGNVELLALPTLVQVEDVLSERDSARIKPIKTLYSPRSKMHVYASTSAMYAMVSLPYVKLSKVSELTKLVNSLAGKEEFEPDKSDYESFTQLRTLMDKLSAKKSTKHLLTLLISSCAEDLTLEKKIETFEEVPSFQLAYELDFKVPHSGPLYQQAGNRKVDLVRLADLKEDDDVIISSVKFSQKKYEELKGELGNYLVAKSVPGIGAQNQRKRWVELRNTTTMNVGLLRRIFKAIAKDNNATKDSSATQAPNSSTTDTKKSLKVTF
jgi:hypothetical protein